MGSHNAASFYLQAGEEEDWSDHNLSVESPPNPQSLETLQPPAEVLQSTSQSALSSVQWVGLAADYLLYNSVLLSLLWVRLSVW